MSMTMSMAMTMVEEETVTMVTEVEAESVMSVMMGSFSDSCMANGGVVKLSMAILSHVAPGWSNSFVFNAIQSFLMSFGIFSSILGTIVPNSRSDSVFTSVEKSSFSCSVFRSIREFSSVIFVCAAIFSCFSSSS